MIHVRLVFYLNNSVNFLNRKPDSVVCIATTLWAGGVRGIESRGGQYFQHSQQSGSWGPPNLP